MANQNTTITVSVAGSQNYLPVSKVINVSVETSIPIPYPSIDAGSYDNQLIFDNTIKQPTYKNYDPDKIEISGTTSAINAGTYTITFTPKSNYSWSDGTTTGKNATWTIGKATINNYPSQSGTLSYTGSFQSPTWNYYDSSKMMRSGTTSGTNAGTYTATFTPTSNYQWSDGTTNTKNISWTISKINDSLTLSKTSMSFSSVNSTNTSTASGYHGTLSATTSNSSVATVSVSGSTITVTCKGSGSATITVTSSATTNYYSISKSISISASVPQKIQYTPSQSGTLTYNGSSKTPSWSNYNSSQLTMGGTTSGTNAGTYTATFTPKSGYTWSDGTTTAKNVNWVIGKGTLNFDVSPTSINVDAGLTTDIYLSGYTYDSYNSTDGYRPRVTMTFDKSGYANASFINTSATSGAKVQITGQKGGTVTLTLKTNDNNYNQVTKTVTITIKEELELYFTRPDSDTKVTEISVGDNSTSLMLHNSGVGNLTGTNYLTLTWEKPYTNMIRVDYTTYGYNQKHDDGTAIWQWTFSGPTSSNTDYYNGPYSNTVTVLDKVRGKSTKLKVNYTEQHTR